MDNKIKKKYDVVILTHRPKDDCVLLLNMLLKQTMKPEKIIIYNTEKKIFYDCISDKKAFEKILKNEKIKVVHIKEKDFDHGKARNAAARYGKSEYIVFMTDDAIPYDKNFIKNMMQGFKNEKVAVVYARQIAKTNAKLKEKYVREFNYPQDDILKDKTTEKKYGIKNCFCSNTAAMYDKKVFKKLGGFKENLTQNEDMLYAYNVIEKGYKVLYKSNAKVYHSHNLSYMEQYKRNYAIGTFQKMNKEIYDKYNSTSEGKKLVKYVVGKLLQEGHPIMAIDFIIESGFRYIGFKVGSR